MINAITQYACGDLFLSCVTVMDQAMKRNLLVLAIAFSFSSCQEPLRRYNIRSIAGTKAGLCPTTQSVVENIWQDINSFINSGVFGTGPGHRACGCGGPGWRRAAYLNMSDPTQTCPSAWELITTPRRSCARPSNATLESCYSAMFPTQGIQYTQVCGRIIGYQLGHPQAFFRFIDNLEDQYIDGVSLTYGSPREHIWTFANALNEYSQHYANRCPCIPGSTVNIPSFIGDDYFCETGVPTNDPLWDGEGCGPTSTCECTFNNPPWFCKQLPQSTNADLEVRLCSFNVPAEENTPVELIELYVK